MIESVQNAQKTGISSRFQALLEKASRRQCDGAVGVVRDVIGLCVTIHGLEGFVSIGDRIAIRTRLGNEIQSEVVGFHNAHARVMAFGTLRELVRGVRLPFP